MARKEGAAREEFSRIDYSISVLCHCVCTKLFLNNKKINKLKGVFTLHHFYITSRYGFFIS